MANKEPFQLTLTASEIDAAILAAKNPVSYEPQTPTPEQQSQARENIGAEYMVDYDQNVKAIAHRGFSTVAPENTIPAYILAKQMGYKYVECDVSFTADNVAVLLHDAWIDRTSNGTGAIGSMTYEQAKQYDYGSWKSIEYTGTTIPTFDEFILLCKKIGLHPYIELKENGAYTEEQIVSIVESVHKHSMAGKVTYVTFNNTYLEYVKNADPSARMGFTVENITEELNIETILAQINALKTDSNSVFLNIGYWNVTDELVARCIEYDVSIEVWTVNSEYAILHMNPYVTGVASDSLNAGKILYEDGMVFEPYVPDEPDEPSTDVSGNIPLTQGAYHDYASTNYIDTANMNRVSYVGTGVPLTSGKNYRIIGVDGIRYGVKTVTDTGLEKVLAKQNLSTGDTIDPGWKTSGYAFVAAENAACLWITASKPDNSAITPAEAMPVKIEEIEIPDNMIEQWDFTVSEKSMFYNADLYHTGDGSTVSTDDGLVLSATDAVILGYLNNNCATQFADVILEIDVGDCNVVQNGSNKILFGSMTRTISPDAWAYQSTGFGWRNTNGAWSIAGYTSNDGTGTWNWDNASEITDINAFANSTVRMDFNSTGGCDVYRDGVYLCSFTMSLINNIENERGWINLAIKSSEILEGAVIKAVRILSK